MSQTQDLHSNILKTISYLKTKKKILFLTTSNRWSGEYGGEKPKSTQLAEKIKEILENEKIGNDGDFAKDLGFGLGDAAQPEKDFFRSDKLKPAAPSPKPAFSTNQTSTLEISPQITILDVPKLKIYPCEGNVSSAKGNSCGLMKAMLENPEFNPSGFHRCWASINNPDDELWKISKELFQSDCVLIFGSIRWGQMNSNYQKLLERLTWIENRHSTLGENNIVKNIDAGLIAFGQNWNGANVITMQKEVLEYFGFQTPKELFWNWQFLEDSWDETEESYKDAAKTFEEILTSIS